MDEPTKEAIEEVYKLAKELVATHAREVSPLMLFPDEIANLIAHVRKKAHDDALEEVAVVCDELTNFWDECGNLERARTYTAFAKSIRSGWNDTALKDQPSGEQP